MHVVFNGLCSIMELFVQKEIHFSTLFIIIIFLIQLEFL